MSTRTAAWLAWSPAAYLGREMDEPTQRTIDALENIALELERLRLLKEHELGVEVVGDPDPHVPPRPT